MNKNLLYTLFFALSGLFFASCSDNGEFDPFTQQNKGDFYPTEVTLRKNSNSMDITESWSNIIRDKQDKVISRSDILQYEFSFTCLDLLFCER